MARPSGYTKRRKIRFTENGGGARIGCTARWFGAFNCAPVEADSNTQFLYRPAIRYRGTDDRNYCVTCNTNKKITIKYLDEADGIQSDPVELATSADVNSHNGGSAIVLQHQTGTLAGQNGTLMAALVDWTVDIQSRRTDQSVDTTEWGSLTWGAENLITNEISGGGVGYAFLMELDDGTIICVYQVMGSVATGGMSFRTCKLSAINPDDDSWSDPVRLCGPTSSAAPVYGKPAQRTGTYGNDWHFGMHKIGTAGDTHARYYDIMYIKKTSTTAKSTATSGSSGTNLEDTAVNFTSLGVAVGWRVYNLTDNTHTYVTAIVDEHNLTIANSGYVTNGEEYILYKFVTAGGTLKKLPLDMSDADHTPDMVYESIDSPEHRTAFWDIVVDASNNPYIAFVDHLVSGGWGVGISQDVYWAQYTAGAWSCEDTGVNTCTLDAQWSAGCGISEADPFKMMIAYKDTTYTEIRAYQRVSGTWYLADGNNGTTAICTDGKVTQASLGYNFRPCYVRDAARTGWPAVEFFEWLWFQSVYDYADTDVMYRFAYPGYSSGQWIGFKKNVRSDFGDVRFTLDDGEILLGYNGKPFIHPMKVDYNKCEFWVGKIDLPASGTYDNYCYHGKSDETNENDTTVMLANFQFADDFPGANGDPLNTDRWETDAGSIGIGYDNNMKIEGTTGTRGKVHQKLANYPDIGYPGRFLFGTYFPHTYPANNQWGLAKDSIDVNDSIRLVHTSANVLTFYCYNGGSGTSKTGTFGISLDYRWRFDWISGDVKWYRYSAVDWDDVLVQEIATNVPSVDLEVFAWEGTVATNNLTFLTWLAIGLWVNPAPVQSVLFEETMEFHVESETLGMSEGSVRKGTLSPQLCGDTEVLTEAALAAWRSFRPMDETVVVAEAIVRRQWSNYLEAGIETIPEGLGRKTWITEIADDLEALAESLLRRGRMIGLMNEGISILETMLTTIHIFMVQIMPETLALLEGIIRRARLSKVAPETSSISESAIRRGWMIKLKAETLSIGESLMRRLRSVRPLAETVEMAEGAVVKLVGIVLVKIMDDAEALLESAAMAFSLKKISTETEVITETIVNRLRSIRLMAETETLMDSLLRRARSNRIFAETETIADAGISFLYTQIVEIMLETEAILDSIIRRFGLVQRLSEMVNITEGHLGIFISTRHLLHQLISAPHRFRSKVLTLLSRRISQ